MPITKESFVPGDNCWQKENCKAGGKCLGALDTGNALEAYMGGDEDWLNLLLEEYRGTHCGHKEAKRVNIEMLNYFSKIYSSGNGT